MADTGTGTSITFSGRVLHYTCDSTTVTDSSGNGNTGIVSGSGTTSSLGLINNKLTFTGSGWLKFTNTTLLGLAAANSEISVSAWVNMAVSQNNGSILSLRNSTNANSIFDFVVGYNGIDNGATGKLSVVVRDDSGTGYTHLNAPTAINDGNWHHVVVTRTTAKLLTLYVDGVSVISGADTLAGSITPNVTNSSVCNELVFGSPLAGSLDDLQIYNRALSVGEIVAIYNGGLGIVSYVLSATNGAFAFTGIAAGSLIRRVAPFATGTFAVTGNAAGGLSSLTLTASTGNFALTGFTTGSASAYLLSAAPAAFLLTGIPVGLTKTGMYAIVASPGAFVLTGPDAGSLSTYIMPAASSAFAVTGIAAGTLYGRPLTASTGNFVTTGLAANLTSIRTLTATPAAFLLTGIPIGLSKTGAYDLVANTGVFALTGQPVNIIYTPPMPAARGVFAFTGQSASLVYTSPPNKFLITSNTPFFLSGSWTVLDVERIAPVIPPPPGVLNFGRRVWLRHW